MHRYVARLAARCVAILVAVAIAPTVQAEEQGACIGFSWPLETEIALMKASDAVRVSSGSEVARLPDTAIVLGLEKSGTAALAVKSGVKKQAVPPESFSGWLRLGSLPRPGLYQVSLSHEGWIDVAQDRELLQSTAFTGNRECVVLRKSVRFEIGPGPVVIQVVGAPAAEIRVTIREAW